MKSQKTTAIVLKRTNYGEADRILQVITPTGKKSVIAKAVRREKSKLAGGIELFAVCEITIAEGKGDIGTLTSARLVHFYRHIMEDYDRMQFAYNVIKIISKASEMVDEPEWYDILQETLAGLDSKTIYLSVVQAWFYLHYSSLMGYELNLTHDEDGNKIEEVNKYRYDIASRSLVESVNGNINSDHIKFMRILATKSLNVIAKIGGLEDVTSECLAISRDHASI